ncbi:hypothetical protein [Streptomyces sp. DSM 40907]|uniref:hypothetical protein n=1 Tax=Streptomyces kutzneri TaxID=3051179 RepID=UPI0028D09894|nr:hypothetical protein [Streptomyces sp. DSM 40907]
MNHLLCGLAANPALPPELVDRLLTRALKEAGTSPDRDYADELLHDLTDRTDLRRDQVLALAAHARSTAVPLAYGGTLAAADVDPCPGRTRPSP